MSAPLIWIVLPMAAALVFWLLRKRTGLVIFQAVILCLLLALLAWQLPIGSAVRIGPVSFEIDPTLAFAGRRLVITNADKVLLVFVYLLCAFWFGGSRAAGASRLMIPFGLGIVALLVAAIAVDPFLYAALLIEMAVLLAVPLLSRPVKYFGQGVLRFLIFQTLAMPFILLSGWAMSGVEANPSNTLLVTLATVFLGLGFAFWLAVFPFYTWIPLLAEQSFPYVSGFIFMALPTINLLHGLSFLDQFGWLRALPGTYPVMAQIGTLMVVTAGVWAAFQKDLSRLLGYSVIVETGFSIMAIGLGSRIGMELFASMFLPRLVGFGLWALSLSIFVREAGSSRFEDVGNMSEKLPFASVGLAVASLSLAGLPLLAVFPVRQVLLEEIARQSFLTAVWGLVGMVGMLFSTFRALMAISAGRRVAGYTSGAGPESAPRRYAETPAQIVLLVIGTAGLLLLGIFPQVFLPWMNGLLGAFPRLP